MVKKEKNSPRERRRKFNPVRWIILVAVILLGWGLEVLLPHRIIVLLCMVGCIASVVMLVTSFRSFMKGKETKQIHLWVEFFGMAWGVVSFLGFMYTTGAYVFYQEPFLPFWKLSLILGLAVGVFVTVKWVWKHVGGWIRLGSIALCTFFAFFLFLFPLCHLNYLLDFHPPVEKQAVIEEKDVVHHRKSSNTYEFEMTMDGERVSLNVGWLEYQKYEVGDTYTFKEYRGAFGKPFYVAED